jgi:hypothetical protein
LWGKTSLKVGLKLGPVRILMMILKELPIDKESFKEKIKRNLM